MDNNSTPSNDDLHEFLRGWNNLMDEYRALVKAEKEYNQNRGKFCSEYAFEVIELTLDYFPELVYDRKLLTTDLKTYGVLLLDKVSELVGHYEHNKDGYCFGLFEPEFTISTITEKKKADILSGCKSPLVWEKMRDRFNTNYAKNFYHEVYLWQLFKLIKKLVPNNYAEVFDLPAKGFRELDGFLYTCMLQTFEIIVETQTGEAYFTEHFSEEFIHPAG